jgi:putative thioredoxin
MADSPWVINVREDNFEKDVLERSRQLPVVIDFWAPWCGPCRALGPILEKLADEFQGQFILAKINSDEAPQLAGAFGVEGIPAVFALRNGQLVSRFSGVLPEAQVREFLQQVLPTEAEKMATDAATRETSDPKAAETEYQQVLTKDPRNPAALLGLARLALARGDEKAVADFLGRTDFVDEFEAEAQHLRGRLELREKAREFGDETAIRKKLEADAKNAQLRYQLGVVLAASARYRDALEALLAAGEADPKLAASSVRETMVKIFQTIGVRHELSDEFRPKLSRLLY